MPQIAEYNAPDLSLRPSEVGIEATAAAARRVNTAYNEKAELQKETGRNYENSVKDAGDVAETFIAHQEISRGANAFTALQLGKTKEWEDISSKSDPNNPTTAQNFIQNSLTPSLEAFRKSFITEKGQAWADQHIQSFQDHMMKKATADMSTAAGHAITINHAATVQNLSNTVYTDPSPENLDHALSTLDSATGGVVGTSPTLRGKAGVKQKLVEEGKSSIVDKALQGYIDKNGEVPPWASDPKYSQYIDLADAHKRAETEKHKLQIIDNANQKQNDYYTRKDFNNKVNKLEDSTAPENPGDPPRLPNDYWDRYRELQSHPGADLPAGRRQLDAIVSKGNAITKRLNAPEALAPVSHATTMELMGKIRSGEITAEDNGEVYDRFEQGKLNKGDFNFLRNELNEAKTPQGQQLKGDRADFFKKYGRSIDTAMDTQGMPSALGQQQIYAAEMAARQQEDDLRKAHKDPHSVYDPRSPEYFGKPENLQKYQITLQQAQQYDREVERKGKAGELGVPTPAPAAPAAAPAPAKPPVVRQNGIEYRLGSDGNYHPSSAPPSVPMSR